MPIDAVTSTSSSTYKPVTSSSRPAPTIEAVKHGSTLRLGQEGESVRTVQQQLNKAGAQPPLTEDGNFGSKTDTAVRHFQARAGLKVDGLVGSKTLQALQNGNSVEGEATRRNRTTAAASTGTTAAATAPLDPPRSTRPVTTTRGIAPEGTPTTDAAETAGAAGTAPPVGASNKEKLDYAKKLAKSMGLTITSATREGEKSAHGRGHAIDVQDPATKAKFSPKLEKYYREMEKLKASQLIYDHIGYSFKGMPRTNGEYDGNHYNHVHVAFE